MSEPAVDRVPVPPAVWVFGLSTLIPFFVASGIFCYGPVAAQSGALMALLAYSTAMVSYFGGVRSGLEIENKNPRWLVLGISLVFPLAGFGLLLGELHFEPAWQLSGFLLLFLLQWVWDVTDHDGPAWRPRMRTLLTSGAAISLAFSLEQALNM
ncbi:MULTISPECIES: DUF3429 domain-containing protein [unclassified Caulobacter]|uniref:DUF3429 domain-containing protein n=1 Tax=unclassified Caulobacter TaxID=2648921 RepID=UPI000D377339|nr:MULTISPECIES: DUF3429 domain-containing protein [unclassified Caulobacter]PTS89084.1 DUF3429 domain-containing protein [Caulobacter sp. HMWF009]PTT05063.1 DUF3429 domain-containing protein [Caulobacter sp. HMWF025]